MLNFCSLFSSSSANCLLAYDETTKILIDCGSSLKKTSAALSTIGIDIANINAILITHEHSDHVAGLVTTSNKYSIPVYANAQTFNAISDCEKIKNVKILNSSEFQIGTCQITAFKIPHDAINPSGYVIKSGNSQITIATDLGYVDRDILEYFENSDFAFIESNHDLKMLLQGSYPYHLKRRIMSNLGHLSNEACSDLVCYLAAKGVRNFMLGHLSESNNTPSLALSATLDALNFNGLEISALNVATKDKISEIITV